MLSSGTSLSDAGTPKVFFAETPILASQADATVSTTAVTVMAPQHTVSTSIDSTFVGLPSIAEDAVDAGTSPIVLAPSRAAIKSSVSGTVHSTPEDPWEVREGEVEVADRIGGGSYGDIFRGRLWGTDIAVKLIVAAVATEDVSVLMFIFIVVRVASSQLGRQMQYVCICL